MSTLSLFVPGRLCLFGEHSDWAGSLRSATSSIYPGAALVLNLSVGIQAQIESYPNLSLSSSLGGSVSIPLQSLLSHARSNSPWRFAAGVAYIVHQRFNVAGVKIRVKASTLPAGRGLSSSAAVCVLVARAFNMIHDLNLTVAGEMDLAYAGERVTGSACGRMDQVVALGKETVVRMDFDGEVVTQRPLQANGGVIWIVLADLGQTKNTEKILQALNEGFAREEGDADANLRWTLGKGNLHLLQSMEDAIRRGDAQRLGKGMTEAQRRFDDAAIKYCEDELASPVLHKTLVDEEVNRLIWGGKGVGSQGDGSVQFVARDYECAQALDEVLRRILGTEPYIVSIGQNPATEESFTACEESSPFPELRARSVTTAVIPAAGFGTRLFPASRSIRPKALFPIIDDDGFAKPLLLHLVEQCVNAGMTKVIIVVGPRDQDSVREVFSRPSGELFDALKKPMKEYAEKIAELSSVVEIAVQEEPNGFGHAVSCADIEDEDPFMLLLGDVAFKRMKGHDTCLNQVLDAFEEDPTRSVIGVTQVDVKEAGAYGVVRMEECRPGFHGRIGVSEVVEKPDSTTARNLSRDGKCWIVLGPYVFTPALMKQLRRDVALNRRSRGEIQLTSAMVNVLEEEGLDCLCMKGEALDTGNATDYSRTIEKLATQ